MADTNQNVNIFIRAIDQASKPLSQIEKRLRSFAAVGTTSQRTTRQLSMGMESFSGKAKKLTSISDAIADSTLRYGSSSNYLAGQMIRTAVGSKQMEKGAIKADLAFARTDPKFKKLAVSMKRFRFEALGIMFAGMAIQKIFAGITKAGMDMYGMTELINTAMGVTMLPILDLIGPALFDMVDMIMGLGEGEKIALGFMVLLGQAFGTMLMGLGQVILFMSSLQAMGGLAGLLTELKLIFASMALWVGKPFTFVVGWAQGTWAALQNVQYTLFGRSFTAGQALKGIVAGAIAIHLTLTLADLIKKGLPLKFGDLWPVVLEVAVLGAVVGGYKGAAIGVAIFLGFDLGTRLADTWKKLMEGEQLTFELLWPILLDAAILGMIVGGWKGSVVSISLTAQLMLGMKLVKDFQEGDLQAASWDLVGLAIQAITLGVGLRIATALGGFGGGMGLGGAAGRLRGLAGGGAAPFKGVTGAGFAIIPSVLMQPIANFFERMGALIPGAGPLPTEMQAGGIVTSPTPILAGEAGPEAIIPLDRMGAIGETNIVANYNIQASISNDMDIRELATRLNDYLVADYRRLSYR